MTPSVLFVIPDIPYPLVSGGHLRDWQILNILNTLGMKASVLYFRAGEEYDLSPESPVQALVASLAYGGARIEHPDRGLWDTARRKLGYLIGTAGGSFPFSYQYDAMGGGKKIIEQAKAVRADVVILRSFWCHHAVELKRAGIKVIANSPDYNTRLALEMVKSVRNPLKKIGPICNYAGVLRQERTYLLQCDEVWVPTEEEAREVARVIPEDRLLVFPNLLDVKSHPDYSREAVEEGSLMFIGNYGYKPNANAAKLLLTKIFPAVKTHCQTASLYLIGRGLPGELAKLAKRMAGVEVMGFVPDVKPYYKKAAVVVCPVTEGGGMLFKVLEAISMGKIVVGFVESFRGIPQDGDGPFFPVHSWHEMVQKVLEILRSNEQRVFLGRKNKEFAEKELSWEKGKRLLMHSKVLSRKRTV